MAVLSPAQIAQYAAGAGFRGNALTVSVAVALAESGGNTTVVNSIGAVGLWQILVSAHPEYSTGWLQNPANNAQAAYKISSGGSNWQPWQTYTNGAYRQYLNVASQAVSQTPTVSPPRAAVGVPAWCKPLMAHSMQWWEQNSNHYPTSSEGFFEGGVDWTPPPGTPITALLSGTIIGAGYFCKNPTNLFASSPQTCGGRSVGYGVVTIRSTNPLPGVVPGTMIDIYYQHIILDPSIVLSNRGGVGQKVVAGQVIGKSNPVFNIEVGVNIGREWGGIWGTSSAGPHVDPIPFLYTLVSGGVPSSGVPLVGTTTGGFFSEVIPTYMHLSDMVHTTLVDTPGFYGIALALDEAEQFPGWVDLTQPQPDITIVGQDTGVALPDIPGEIRSIGATISDNFIPFAVRSGLVSIGLLLMMALLIKAAEGPVKALAPLALAA